MSGKQIHKLEGNARIGNRNLGVGITFPEIGDDWGRRRGWVGFVPLGSTLRSLHFQRIRIAGF